MCILRGCSAAVLNSGPVQNEGLPSKLCPIIFTVWGVLAQDFTVVISHVHFAIFATVLAVFWLKCRREVNAIEVCTLSLNYFSIVLHSVPVWYKVLRLCWHSIWNIAFRKPYAPMNV